MCSLWTWRKWRRSVNFANMRIGIFISDKQLQKQYRKGNFVLLWPDMFDLVLNSQTRMVIKSLCAACALIWAPCFCPNKVMLPCTWVWYTTKKSLFPQLSKSSPTHRWRHSSSSSRSCSVKRGVGKPQWHFSPPKAARENSYTDKGSDYLRQTRINTVVWETPDVHHAYILTFSVHMSTHLSTDMFWITALAGSARVTLSGLLKHPLKMALPS